eukprot:scaffold367641_cov17-Prasinocladus_malaysianus.AAC.1
MIAPEYELEGEGGGSGRRRHRHRKDPGAAVGCSGGSRQPRRGRGGRLLASHRSACGFSYYVRRVCFTETCHMTVDRTAE